MSALLLRLAGPLQSWGTSSRFNRRATDPMPSKSAVIGLLAAAEGRRRTESIEHLLGLRFAVRTDQSGTLVRDFQTAARPGERTPVSVSTRHYLADAIFLAAVEGEDDLLAALTAALRAPYFPLYLGRRSCPPVGRVHAGLRDADAVTALRNEPWRAATWYQRSRRNDSTVSLGLVSDGDPRDPTTELVRDQPVAHGFDPRHRQWEWRAVVRHPVVEVANPEYTGDRHEPMGVV